MRQISSYGRKRKAKREDPRESVAHPTKIRAILSDKSNDASQNIFVVDSGGGLNCSVTKRAWRILEYTSHKVSMVPYGADESEAKTVPIVNAITKVVLPDREEPVLVIVNYANLVDNENELESLSVPFPMQAHGCKVDQTLEKFGGEQGLLVEDCFMPFEWDGEKLFWRIEKPTLDELDTLECFELTSPINKFTQDPIPAALRRKKSCKLSTEDIPMIE